VQWEGYDSDEDSWEPVGNLRLVSHLLYANLTIFS
jgi:hypothetical protein